MEQALLSQIGRRPEAFRALYRHYFPRVYGYVAYRVSSAQDAEDLTSEIFVKVVESISSFEHRGAGSFAAWLFRIAHNTVKQFYRVANPGNIVMLDDIPEPQSLDHSPDELVMFNESSAALRSMIQTLSPRRQEIVALRFFGGLRNQDIAAVLNLDERTVASHLCRALEDLQHRFQEEGVVDAESL